MVSFWISRSLCLNWPYRYHCNRLPKIMCIDKLIDIIPVMKARSRFVSPLWGGISNKGGNITSPRERNFLLKWTKQASVFQGSLNIIRYYGQNCETLVTKFSVVALGDSVGRFTRVQLFKLHEYPTRSDLLPAYRKPAFHLLRFPRSTNNNLIKVMRFEHPETNSTRTYGDSFGLEHYVLVSRPRRQASIPFLPQISSTPFNFFLVIMSIEHKNDGFRRNHLRKVSYSEVTWRPPANPVTQMAKLLQQRTRSDGTPPPFYQESRALLADVQTSADDLRFVRTDLSRIHKRWKRMLCSKTVFSAYDSSEESSRNIVEE